MLGSVPGAVEASELSRLGALWAYKAHETLGEVERDGDVVTYAFGGATPRLITSPLRLSVIELERGEVISERGVLIGDSKRWTVVVSQVGERPVLALKPERCGLSTNLVVLTDRRLYTLDVEAAACERTTTDPETPFVRRARFRFGEGTGVYFEGRPTPTAQPIEPTTATPTGPVCERFLGWRADRRFPWRPVAICEGDGQTTLFLPAGLEQPLGAVMGPGDEVVRSERIALAGEGGLAEDIVVIDGTGGGSVVLTNARGKSRRLSWGAGR